MKSFSVRPESSQVWLPSPLSIRVARHLENLLRLPPSTLTAWWADGLMIQHRTWSILARHRLFVSIALGLATLAIVVLIPNDLVILDWMHRNEAGSGLTMLNQAARELSYWGDFMGFNMLVFVGLGLTAKLLRSLFFRRLVIAAVIGSMACGTLANISRVLTGRARPSYKGEPGFYGPTLSANRQSFPSAHTATAFGASVPVAVALPPVGVPMMILSAGVAWSRMHNNRHHPSDVLTSILLSVFFGVPLGIVVRRISRVEL
jgi:membrane-associated phospholipid phosphatase